MKKSLFNYLFYSFILFFVGVISVYAYYPTVSINKDLITASYTSSGRFYINNSSDFSTSSYFQATEKGGWIDTSTNKKAMVSVKNGTYYIWHKMINGQYSSPYKVVVSNSCDNQLKQNQTGTFTMERCFIKTSSGTTMEQSLNNVNLCATGYKATGGNVVSDTCSSMSLSGLSKRYCQKTYQFTCVKGTTPTVPAATLSALSISSGTLSPTFKASTKKYTATVASNVSSVKVSATAASGGTLVSGYGSRTVKLGYGNNTIKVQVKNSAGTVTTYTIVVNRKDSRSGVNTLSNLTISTGTLSPAFSSDVTKYSVKLDNSISSLSINATVTDSKSKFVSGFGPRSVALKEGVNQVQIKVKSEKGTTKIYTINVTRGAAPDVCQNANGDLALLKGIGIETNEQNPITLDDFDQNRFEYGGITVPFAIRNLIITPLVLNESDEYEVNGADDLEVNIEREITILVKSKACPAITNTYTLRVTRLPEEEMGGTADLKSLTIKNHKEFEFQKNKLEYGLTIKEDEKKLEIEYETELEGTKCSVKDNDGLKLGSIVSIECISEDGVDTAVYTITIDGVKKGTNMFLVILLIIIIIIILILLIMRLLGYKIYFNMEAVKAAFRGMGEKAKNTFDK